MTIMLIKVNQLAMNLVRFFQRLCIKLFLWYVRYRYLLINMKEILITHLLCSRWRLFRKLIVGIKVIKR